MSVKKEILNDHIIYGTWDDTYGYQFIAHYHPNGQTATVFTLSGCDYGGGVNQQSVISSKVLDKLVNQYDDEYTLYMAVKRLIIEVNLK